MYLYHLNCRCQSSCHWYQKRMRFSVFDAAPFAGV